jgi:hypothetical protein
VEWPGRMPMLELMWSSMRAGSSRPIGSSCWRGPVHVLKATNQLIIPGLILRHHRHQVLFAQVNSKIGITHRFKTSVSKRFHIMLESFHVKKRKKKTILPSLGRLLASSQLLLFLSCGPALGQSLPRIIYCFLCR